MRKFLESFILFLVPIVVMAVGTELFVRSIPNSYKYKDEWIKRNGEKVKLLILGNSTTNASIMPNLLDSAFSMANSSQNLEYDYYILKKYLQYCPNLKTIILPIDYGNLFAPDYEDEDGFSGYRAMYYKIYMDYPKNSNWSKWNFEICNPLSLRNKILKFFNEEIVTGEGDYGFDEWGRTTEGRTYTAKSEDKDETVAEKYVRSSISLYKDNMEYTKNKLYVENIADICDKAGLKLLLVTCPKWYGVLEKLKKNRVKKIEELKVALCNKHKSVKYKNFLYDKRFIKEPSFFRDVTHMTDKGALYFTQVLSKELE